MSALSGQFFRLKCPACRAKEVCTCGHERGQHGWKCARGCPCQRFVEHVAPAGGAVSNDGK